MEKYWDVVSWIGEKLVWLWENVLKPILDSLETAYKWIKDLVGGSEQLEVQINKTITTNPNQPTTPIAPSYAADLTRFKNGEAGSAISEGEKEKKKNREVSHKTGDTISGGGPRVVNIHLGKFFDNLQFTTMNTGETTNQIEKLIMECMGRMLYEGAKNM